MTLSAVLNKNITSFVYVLVFIKFTDFMLM